MNNAAHLHLILNHFPLIGSIIGTLVLIAGFLLKNNQTVKQTALGILIFSAVAGIIAYITGEGAEEIAETLLGVTESFIEVHEDWAKLFLIFLIVTGTISTVTLLLSIRKNQTANVLYWVVLLTSLATCWIARETGTSGGEIRHTEIRKSTFPVNGAENSAKPFEEDND